MTATQEETLQKEAIILIYPSTTQTMKELRQSVSDFCIQNNIIPMDTISPYDEHDYFAIRRLAQILTRSAKPIKLITNKNILSIMPILTLWAILDKMVSTKPIDLMYDFIEEIKANSSKINNQNTQELSILEHKEVRYMSDWLNDIRYAVTKDSRGRYEQQS